jgi:hypothetical protein
MTEILAFLALYFGFGSAPTHVSVVEPPEIFSTAARRAIRPPEILSSAARPAVQPPEILFSDKGVAQTAADPPEIF